MRGLVLSLLFLCVAAFAQTPDLKQRPADSPVSDVYRVDPGTRILLTMTNSVSTKNAQVGDRLYAKTSFPVLVNGRIVIPEGSYVNGTITDVKRAGRVKGRSSIQVRFDSLILPNGTTRDFKSDLGSVDGSSGETLDREHSTVKGESGKGHDAETIAKTTAGGAGIGTIAGAGTGRWAQGLGIGSAAGAAAGIATVLLTRGPEATLSAGSAVELVTDRPLDFHESELIADQSQHVKTFQLKSGTAETESHGGFKPAQQ